MLSLDTQYLQLTYLSVPVFGSHPMSYFQPLPSPWRNSRSASMNVPFDSGNPEPRADDLCVGMCVEMCVDMCVHMCVGMCFDI